MYIGENSCKKKKHNLLTATQVRLYLFFYFLSNTAEGGISFQRIASISHLASIFQSIGTVQRGTTLAQAWHRFPSYSLVLTV